VSRINAVAILSTTTGPHKGSQSIGRVDITHPG
jgi:hypothetical protein